MAKSRRENSYIGQVFNALSEIGSQSSSFDVVFGDFNANKIWDHLRVRKNFSAVANRLAELGHQSAYHAYHRQAFGAERHPTFYLYRHLEKPYHIDYCFLCPKLRRKLDSVKVGRHKVWTEHSDHVPLIIDLK